MSITPALSSDGATLVLQPSATMAAMTSDEFFEFCRLNADLRIERTAEGELLIMTPTGGEGGRRNLQLSAQLAVWSNRDGTGVAFDSSTAFYFPNGATRSPDASWIRRERWLSLCEKDRNVFPPIAPDFVIELRSESDRMALLREKMDEYIACGVRLAWLVDPFQKRVAVYRPGQDVVVLDDPATVAADPELAGFVLKLAPIW